MLTSRGKILALALFLVVATVLGGCKSAEKWPGKGVTIVWHSGAGSGGDIFLRNMAKAMETEFKQPFVVENRTGSGGANAWNYVKPAKPDGYILLGISSTILSAPAATPMGISWKDFKPIAQVMYDPTVIYVKPGKYASWADLAADAKANPGKQKWAGGSAGSAEAAAAMKACKVAGIEVTNVPFESGGDVVVAVLGGHVDVGIGEYAEIAGQVKAGELAMLVTFGSTRIPGINVPTLKEVGVDFVFEKLRGLMGPKDLPDDIVNQLATFIETKLYKDAGFKNYFESSYIYPLFRKGAELVKALEAQDAFFKEMFTKK